MGTPIYTCLWYDGKAEEAADYYCSIIPDSRVTSRNPVVTEFTLAGSKFIALNGGPHYTFTPATSLFVTCESKEEIDRYWSRLTQGGTVLMELGPYDWSEYYGWCADRYGLTWQVYLGNVGDVRQKVVPLLLFVNTMCGRAEEAIRWYTGLFGNSRIDGIARYGANAPLPEGHVMHAQFVLTDRVFMAMDGPGEHRFDFNEAVSFVVECDSQKEIDAYWDAITKEGTESMCGWCKDRYGVSWQIIPAQLKELMADPVRGPRVVQAFMKMKKFDLGTILRA